MSSRLDRITDWSALGKKADYDARILAPLCGVSARHLQRYFKEKFQESPQEWLDKLRLKEAEGLLKSGISIKETAFLLRFKQVPHFSRQFKMFHGRTPGSVAHDGAAEKDVASG
jgi:transcriptional regulator GlxA family with amidase domain